MNIIVVVVVDIIFLMEKNVVKGTTLIRIKKARWLKTSPLSFPIKEVQSLNVKKLADL